MKTKRKQPGKTKPKPCIADVLERLGAIEAQLTLVHAKLASVRAVGLIERFEAIQAELGRIREQQRASSGWFTVGPQPNYGLTGVAYSEPSALINWPQPGDKKP